MGERVTYTVLVLSRHLTEPVKGKGGRCAGAGERDRHAGIIRGSGVVVIASWFQRIEEEVVVYAGRRFTLKSRLKGLW